MTVFKTDNQHTIPKALVHKHALDAVFITGYEVLGPESIRISALLPRAHGFYCEFPLGPRRPDFALLVEVCRQAYFIVAHVMFEVPWQGNPFQFLFQDLDVDYFWGSSLRDRMPVALELVCRVGKTYRRGKATSGLICDFTITSEGEICGAVQIREMWVHRDRWNEIRRLMRRDRGLPNRVTLPTTPPETQIRAEDVGRINPANIVLRDIVEGPGGATAVALIDARNPALFDHSIDHIYAMVQLEVSRQLGRFVVARDLGCSARSLDPVKCNASFTAIGEFDLETIATARSERVAGSDRARVTVELAQRPRLLSRFSLEFAMV
jgi:hypothetical protein